MRGFAINFLEQRVVFSFGRDGRGEIPSGFPEKRLQGVLLGLLDMVSHDPLA